jgi:hypothetical protein
MDSATARRYEEDDPNFKRDLHESVPSTFAAARWLYEQWNHNITVVIPPIRERPDVKQMKAYGKDPDLIIHGVGKNGKPWSEIIEVRHMRKLSFTNWRDFADEYPSVLIDNVHKWDGLPRKWKFFIFFDDDLSHFGVIKASTREHWYIKDYNDSDKHRPRRSYFCPLEHVDFYAYNL